LLPIFPQQRWQAFRGTNSQATAISDAPNFSVQSERKYRNPMASVEFRV
jgi:hypothetical protein